MERIGAHLVWTQKLFTGCLHSLGAPGKAATEGRHFLVALPMHASMS